MNTKLGMLKQAALAVCLAAGGVGAMPLAHADSFGISVNGGDPYYYAPAYPQRCWYDYNGYYHCRPYYPYYGYYYNGPYYGYYNPGVSFSYYGGFRNRWGDRDDWRGGDRGWRWHR